MKVIIITLFSFFLMQNIATAISCMPPPMYMHDPTPEEPELPSGSSPKGPSNSVNSIGKMLGNFNGTGGNMMGGGGFNNNPDGSGDFGLENLSLSGGFSYSSFDDSSSSGHFRDYSLTLSGDLTENDRISVGVSNSRFETGGTNHILARTYGINVSWVHSLTENYGVGAFALLNDVDIEAINGNSYSYGYGLLLTTFHSFQYFNLSSATAIAHTDFDTGYDQFIMSAWTVSKNWTDKCSSYVTLSFFDSFKDDPDGDPTYGTWEIGGSYLLNENLAVTLGFQRTEFLNNYSDNTLLMNVNWFF